MSKNEVGLLPVLLNGKPFTVDLGGDFAINTDGTAIKLVDPERGSRFR